MLYVQLASLGGYFRPSEVRFRGISALSGNHFYKYKICKTPRGRYHLRFSGIRPLRGFPPPPLNGKSV